MSESRKKARRFEAMKWIEFHIIPSVRATRYRSHCMDWLFPMSRSRDNWRCVLEMTAPSRKQPWSSAIRRLETAVFLAALIGYLLCKSLVVHASSLAWDPRLEMDLDLRLEMEQRRFMAGEPILFTLVIHNRSRLKEMRIAQSSLAMLGGEIHMRIEQPDGREFVTHRIRPGLFEAPDRGNLTVPALSTRKVQLILGDWKAFAETGRHGFEALCCQGLSGYPLPSDGMVHLADVSESSKSFPFKSNRLYFEMEEFDARRYRKIAERFLALALTGSYSAEDFREPMGNHVYGKALSIMNQDVAVPVFVKMYERCSEVVCRKLALEGLARTVSEPALDAIANLDFQRHGDELLILKTLRYLFMERELPYGVKYIRFMPAVPESVSNMARLRFSEIVRKGYLRQEIEQDR